MKSPRGPRVPVVAILLVVAPAILAPSASAAMPDVPDRPRGALVEAGRSSGLPAPLRLEASTAQDNGLVLARFNNGLRVAGPAGLVVDMHQRGLAGDRPAYTLKVGMSAPDDAVVTGTTADALRALGAPRWAFESLGLAGCEFMGDSRCAQQREAHQREQLGHAPPAPRFSSTGSDTLPSTQD